MASNLPIPTMSLPQGQGQGTQAPVMSGKQWKLKKGTGRQARQLSQNSRWKDGWKSFTIPATKWLNGSCSHDFFARVLSYYFGKMILQLTGLTDHFCMFILIEYSEKGPLSHRTWRMESTGRWWNGLSSSFQTQLAKCGRTWKSVSAAK